MLKKKGITLSPSLYFVTALSYMALGLFSTLIIGLIMKTAGGQLLETNLSGFGSTLIEIGDVAIGLTGPAIGIAIAYALQAPPLILFSALVTNFDKLRSSNTFFVISAAAMATPIPTNQYLFFI